MKNCLLLFVFVTLFGCASIEDTANALQRKPSCCSSISNLHYEDIDTQITTSIKFDDESQVYNFPSGKSYYRSFKLPKNSNKKTKLQVRSYATGSFVLEPEKRSQLYCPQVTFLDGSYKSLYSYTKLPALDKKSANIFATSFITEFDIPKDTVFIVLHTHPEWYGTLITRFNTVGDNFADPFGERVLHPCGPFANAEITFQ